jgi:hypothetical protein
MEKVNWSGPFSKAHIEGSPVSPLSRCPFCDDGLPEFKESNGRMFIRCSLCWAQGPSMIAAEAAKDLVAKAWNLRIKVQH